MCLFRPRLPTRIPPAQRGASEYTRRKASPPCRAPRRAFLGPKFKIVTRKIVEPFLGAKKTQKKTLKCIKKTQETLETQQNSKTH